MIGSYPIAAWPIATSMAKTKDAGAFAIIDRQRVYQAGDIMQYVFQPRAELVGCFQAGDVKQYVNDGTR